MWLFQRLATYTARRRRALLESCQRAEGTRSGVEPTGWLFNHSTPRLPDRWFADSFAGLIAGAAATYLAPTLRMRWPGLAHGS